MKVNTDQLQDRLKKLLIFQTRPDVSMALFKDISKKTKEYKKIIDFLETDDIDVFIKEEEGDLDKELLAKHLKA